MNIAAYCRVSTDKADQLNSLEAQKEFFSEYTKRTGDTLVRLYADEGISGTKIKNRKEFLRMMADAEHGLFDMVVVKDISRFARNTVDLLQNVRKLKSLGIETQFLTANMTSMGNSEFVLTIFGALAQEESANTSKRVKFGKKMNAEKGRVPNIVYGYDKTIGDYFNLAINEEEAAVVRQIYEWYIKDGYGAAKISIFLNERGLRTKRNCQWSQNGVCRILTNELYTGKIINGKQEVTDFLTGQRADKDETEWMVVERPDLRIIEPEVFEQAQQIMQSRGKAFKVDKERQSNKYLFSTLIKCKECGWSFRRTVRTYKNTYVRWVCSGHNGRGADNCPNAVTVDEEELIEVLQEYFAELLKAKKNVNRYVVGEFQRVYKAKDENLNYEKELNVQLAKLQKTRQKYMDMYADDLISREELNDKIGGMRKEIERLENELKMVAYHLTKGEQLESVLGRTFKEIEDITDVHQMTNAQLKRIIQKIEVDKDGNVDIYLRLLGDLGLDETVLIHHDETCRADRIIFGEKNFQERKISNRAMMLFGIGDGGGGPGYEHIERLNRYRDIKKVPKVTPGKAIDFFHEIDDKETPYPTYKGELYLERHRGTYTTQSKNKKFNRKCEFALKNYEYLMCIASKNNIELPISKDELDEIWKEILLYQFHDILPGSSINRVYEESVARYEIIYKRLNDAIEELAKALCNADSLYNFNAYNTQVTFKNDEGAWSKLSVPAFGSAKIQDAEKITDFHAKCTENTIENDCVRITFKKGVIVSYYDKNQNFEYAIAKKPMGVYSVYHDRGDCWDILPYTYYKKKKNAVCTEFKTGTDGATAYADMVYKLNDTTIKQRITITDSSPMAEFDIEIDCHQQESMLRVAFPTTIESDECNFNIQFGHIARKTTENNDAEKAQFEVSGHKFVDLSDGSRGLSVLNDCKYGYRCKGSVIDVDLIRSPKGGPGSNVDQGKNTLKLALFPHTGALGEETYKQSYILNNPVMRSSGTAKENLIPQYSTDNSNIVLETVKSPIDSNGLILRFYNSSSEIQKANISLQGYKADSIVNILEEKLSDISPSALTLMPFELINIRFTEN